MMHVTGMTIGGIPPFTERIEFEFDKHVNVFIGPNGCGKTTVLRQIEPAYHHEFEGLTYECRPYAWSDNVTVRVSPVFDSHTTSQLALFEIPAVRIPLPRQDSIVSEYTLVNDFVNLEGVSDNRFTFRKIQDIHNDISGIINDFLTAVFLKEYRGSNQDGLMKWWGDDGTPQSAIEQRVNAIADVVIQCSTSICREIMTGSPLTAHSHSVEQGLQRARGIDQVSYGLWGVPVVDDQTGSVTIGELSSGTQSALMWIWSLAISLNQEFMIRSYGDITARYTHGCAKHGNDCQTDPDEEIESHGNPKNKGTCAGELQLVTGGDGEFHNEWQRMPFVLIVDEIESHLHPTWQRRLIPTLLDFFPNMQLFAATHSPFMVAGLRVGQVHLLSRDANGVVVATTNTEDIVGWTADEILRTMMGVEDPTDGETAAAARELRRIQDEGPRESAEAEAARQAEMSNLRRLVDRDLLAGGPAAAQRELFEQQFAEALEKYQRSRDLGQDSG